MNTKARRKRVQLILNGKVAANDALRAAVARQRKAGHRIQVRVTWEKGDARQFVWEAGNWQRSGGNRGEWAADRRRYPSRSSRMHRRRLARCACGSSDLANRVAGRGARITTASTRWRICLLLANTLAGGAF